MKKPPPIQSWVSEKYTPSQKSPPKRRPALIAFVLTALGIALAIASWFLRDYNEWTISLLSNAAVVFVLLVPGEFALTRIRTRVEQAEDTAVSAQTVADSAQQTAAVTALSLEDIRADLIDRQNEELESNLDIYRNIVKNTSPQSLVNALQQATRDEIITVNGVRSPVWGTDIHYRFIVNDESADLIVRLERDNGETLKAVYWEPEIPTADFYQELVFAVRAAGSDLGVGLNDPTNSVDELSKMLIQITKLRSQEMMGYRRTLRRIIEKRDGWFFTERHIIPEESLSYTIDIDRLYEMDWEKHLKDKKFENVSDTIRFARELYKA